MLQELERIPATMQEQNILMEKDRTLFVASEEPNKSEQGNQHLATSMPPAPQVIAGRLRAARVAARLTQQELAGGLFSKSYISAVERGKMVPSLQALNVLAQRLAVPVSYLLGEQDIALETLEESSVGLSSSEQLANVLPEENLLPLLEQAKACLQAEQPQEALEILGKAETPPAGLTLLQRLRWYRLMGWAAGLLGEQETAIQRLERGLSLALQIQPRIAPSEQAQLAEMVAYLNCFLGNAYCDLGKTHQALDYYQHALEVVRNDQVTDAELKALIYKGLGRVALTLGRYQEASTYYEEAVRQVRHVNNPRLAGVIFWGLAVAYQERGDPFRALTNYRHALTALERHGNPRLLLQIRAGLGQALLALKNYEEAAPYLLLCMQEAQSLGETQTYGIAVVNMASLHQARGELTQAIAVAQTALQWLHDHPDPRTEGQLHLTLASIYGAKEDQAAREQELRAAIRVLEQSREFSVLGLAYESYAQFLSEQGRFHEAYTQMELAHRPRSGEQPDVG